MSDLFEFANKMSNDISCDIENIYEKMKYEANKQSKLYHLTNFSSFINIIKSMEFWAFPLKNMNDRNEYYNVCNTTLSDSIFIISFSSERIKNENHWKTYAKDDLSKAIMFSLDMNWFSNEMYCVGENGSVFEIVRDNIKYTSNINDVRRCILNDFIKVYYKNINIPFEKNESGIIYSIPRFAGFIKREDGNDKNTEQYVKWKDEKEIRKRIALHHCSGFNYNDNKVIVKLNKNAFKNFDIIFSPTANIDDIQKMKREIENILCDSSINYIE